MPTDEAYNILGIDPGTTTLGFALLQVKGTSIVRVHDVGHLSLDPKRSHFERLGDIHQFVLNQLFKHKPKELAIEAPFFGKNVQSMLKLGRAQGVVIATAMSQGMSVAEYAPREIKLALTGRGNSSKEQVAAMARSICGPIPEPLSADATDALGVAICHFFRLGNATQRPKAAGSLRQMGGSGKGKNQWSDFLKANPNRLK